MTDDEIGLTPSQKKCPVCGAVCKPGNEKRFARRHPKMCSERRAFTKQLAQGVRSVEDDSE